MTKLGEFLEKKSIKKADVSRKTGISQSRLSQLVNKKSTKLSAEELYLIALAIDITPSEIIKELCGHLKIYS
jgi:putative transcriptional regulator